MPLAWVRGHQTAARARAAESNTKPRAEGNTACLPANASPDPSAASNDLDLNHSRALTLPRLRSNSRRPLRDVGSQAAPPSLSSRPRTQQAYVLDASTALTYPPICPASTSPRLSAQRTRAIVLLALAVAMAVWGWTDVRLRGTVDPTTDHSQDRLHGVHRSRRRVFRWPRSLYESPIRAAGDISTLRCSPSFVAPLHALDPKTQVLVWFGLSVVMAWGCYGECLRIACAAMPGAQPTEDPLDPIPTWIGSAAVAAATASRRSIVCSAGKWAWPSCICCCSEFAYWWKAVRSRVRFWRGIVSVAGHRAQIHARRAGGHGALPRADRGWREPATTQLNAAAPAAGSAGCWRGASAVRSVPGAGKSRRLESQPAPSGLLVDHWPSHASRENLRRRLCRRLLLARNQSLTNAAHRLGNLGRLLPCRRPASDGPAAIRLRWPRDC